MICREIDNSRNQVMIVLSGDHIQLVVNRQRPVIVGRAAFDVPSIYSQLTVHCILFHCLLSLMASWYMTSIFSHWVGGDFKL